MAPLPVYYVLIAMLSSIIHYIDASTAPFVLEESRRGAKGTSGDVSGTLQPIQEGIDDDEWHHLVYVSVVILYSSAASSEQQPLQSLLTDIILDIIDWEMDYLNCSVLDDYILNTSVSQLYQTDEHSYNKLDAVTNITVCDALSQSLLITNLDASMQLNIEDDIQNGTDIEVQSVYVDTEPLSFLLTIAPETTIFATTNTLTTTTTDPQPVVTESGSFTAALLVIGGVAILMTCLICIFCVMVFSKLTKLQSQSKTDISNLVNTIAEESCRSQSGPGSQSGGGRKERSHSGRQSQKKRHRPSIRLTLKNSKDKSSSSEPNSRRPSAAYAIPTFHHDVSMASIQKRPSNHRPLKAPRPSVNTAWPPRPSVVTIDHRAIDPRVQAPRVSGVPGFTVLNDHNKSERENDFLPTPSDSHDDDDAELKMNQISAQISNTMHLDNNFSIPTMNPPPSVPTMNAISSGPPRPSIASKWTNSNHMYIATNYNTAALQKSYPTNLTMSRQQTLDSTEHDLRESERLSHIQLERQSLGSARLSVTNTMENQVSSQIQEITKKLSTYAEQLSHIQEVEKKMQQSLEKLEFRRKRDDDEFSANSGNNGRDGRDARNGNLHGNHHNDNNGDPSLAKEGSETAPSHPSAQSAPPVAPESTPEPRRLPPLRQVTEETLGSSSDSDDTSDGVSPNLNKPQSHNVVIRIDNALAKSKNGKLGRSKSDVLRPVIAGLPPTPQSFLQPHSMDPHNPINPYNQSLKPRLSTSAMTASSMASMTSARGDIEVDFQMQQWLEITESNSTATTATAAFSPLSSALSGQTALSIHSDFEEGRKQLQQWLLNEVHLPRYTNTFILNGYESLKFIQDIEHEQELEELGIVLKGHKKRIMAEISKLKRRSHPDYDEQIEEMEDEWQQMEEAAEEKAAEEKAEAMGFGNTISVMDVVEQQNEDVIQDDMMNDDDDIVLNAVDTVKQSDDDDDDDDVIDELEFTSPTVEREDVDE